jgi:D-alanyl-D-alanine dipeptidase
MEKDLKILTYGELKLISVIDNGESLVPVNKYDKSIQMVHQNNEMPKITGDVILVRDTVAKKLTHINQQLPDGKKLRVVFGYRPPKVQRQYFEIERNRLKKENPEIKGNDLDELAHVFIAAPEVAGHPCGAAVDITITDASGSEIDMGTKIADFDNSEKMATFSAGLAKLQRINRKLLHDLMVSENFAPFYEEWWHFSYGDKEWAGFYGYNNAIYDEANL